MSKHGTPIHNTRAASRYTPQEQQAAIVTSERQAAITKSIPEISELHNKSDKPLQLRVHTKEQYMRSAALHNSGKPLYST
jgi:hypothetical protein